MSIFYLNNSDDSSEVFATFPDEMPDTKIPREVGSSPAAYPSFFQRTLGQRTTI